MICENFKEVTCDKADEIGLLDRMLESYFFNEVDYLSFYRMCYSEIIIVTSIATSS